jgi:hypothetical protein
MAGDRVEGTSLVSWSVLVAAGCAREASKAAVQIAGRLSDPCRDHALRDVHHQIDLCRRLVEAPAVERVHQRAAAQMRDE